MKPRLVPRSQVLAPALLGLGAALALGSGATAAAAMAARPQGPADFDIARVEALPGTALYPYLIHEVDAFGNPTSRVVEIRSLADLARNAVPGNPVLPVPELSTAPVLPGGAVGNQYLHVRFTDRPARGSLIHGGPTSATTSFLTGAFAVTARDPATGATSFVRGQPFVGGWTYFDDPSTPRFDPELVQAVARRGNTVVVLDPRAAGFPQGFNGDLELVDPRSLVFVADSDGDLSTAETFPVGPVLRIEADRQVTSEGGTPLRTPMCVATTVGPEGGAPAVVRIEPRDGAAGIDPRSPIQLEFDRPVQPLDVGALPPSLTPPAGGVALHYHVAPGAVPLAATAEPRSAGDLCRYRLAPVAALPGLTPVSVDLAAGAVHGLGGPTARPFRASFQTGAGPGIANAPVAPEALYVGVAGAAPGLSVLDLNGFGQGTGELASTAFPTNPNIGVPGVLPPLALGTSSLDAGGAGFLTFTRDHTGDSALLRAPLVRSVTEVQIGQPLDLVFNNSNINIHAADGNAVNPLNGAPVGSNTIAVAPHPNPPRLVFPAPNPSRGIHCEEPTMTTSGNVPGRITTQSPPCLPSPINLLVPGNPFAQMGLLGANFPGVFVGPQPPPPSPPPPPPFCPYTSRQQVGQFLYVLDRDAGRVLVLNSNRFTLLHTFELEGAADISISPNLQWLAVSRGPEGRVTILDIDPRSSTFHQVLFEVRVPRGPEQLAWQPEGEDLLVCHPRAAAVSIVHVPTWSVRRVLRLDQRAPRGVAVSARQRGNTGAVGSYFAYILCGDDDLAVYASGRGGDAGPDAIVAVLAGFAQARAVQPDLSVAEAGCWVAHRDALGLGQVSRVRGTQVVQRIGGSNPTTPSRDLLSGNDPVDVAFDNARNQGALPDRPSLLLPTLPQAAHSGKGQLKVDAAGAALPAHSPLLLFVALADTGKVDVVELDTGRRVASLDAPGVTTLSHYWRQ